MIQNGVELVRIDDKVFLLKFNLFVNFNDIEISFFYKGGIGVLFYIQVVKVGFVESQEIFNLLK